MKYSLLFLKNKDVIDNSMPAAIIILRKRKKNLMIKILPFNRSAFGLVTSYVLFMF